jgi:hypothetical protein
LTLPLALVIRIVPSPPTGTATTLVTIAPVTGAVNEAADVEPGGCAVSQVLADGRIAVTLRSTPTTALELGTTSVMRGATASAPRMRTAIDCPCPSAPLRPPAPVRVSTMRAADTGAKRAPRGALVTPNQPATSTNRWTEPARALVAAARTTRLT